LKGASYVPEGRGDEEKRRRGEEEKRRKGEKEKRRKGEREARRQKKQVRTQASTRAQMRSVYADSI
jgi:hypothetical protein